jgi:hypothetical protein
MFARSSSYVERRLSQQFGVKMCKLCIVPIEQVSQAPLKANFLTKAGRVRGVSFGRVAEKNQIQSHRPSWSPRVLKLHHTFTKDPSGAIQDAREKDELGVCPWQKIPSPVKRDSTHSQYKLMISPGAKGSRSRGPPVRVSYTLKVRDSTTRLSRFKARFV